MKITKIKIYSYDNTTTKVVACVTVIFNEVFACHDIKIVKKNDTYQIVFPKKDNNHNIFHCIDNNFRKYVQKEILEAYLK